MFAFALVVILFVAISGLHVVTTAEWAAASRALRRSRAGRRAARGRHAVIPPHPRFGPLADTPPDGIPARRADGVIRCGGRNLGTLPRIASPTHPPWLTAPMPAVRAAGLPLPADPGDGALPPVSLIRPYLEDR